VNARATHASALRARLIKSSCLSSVREAVVEAFLNRSSGRDRSVRGAEFTASYGPPSEDRPGKERRQSGD
jgi:hypothetical protein